MQTKRSFFTSITAWTAALLLTVAIGAPRESATNQDATLYFGNGTTCKVSMIATFSNGVVVGPITQTPFFYYYNLCQMTIVSVTLNGAPVPNIPVGTSTPMFVPGCGVLTLYRGPDGYEIT